MRNDTCFKRLWKGMVIKMSFFGRKKAAERHTYDKENQVPVLKCSICNGEQIAGFKDIHTGKFQEVMLIRGEDDLAVFREMYGVDEIKKEY